MDLDNIGLSWSRAFNQTYSISLQIAWSQQGQLLSEVSCTGVFLCDRPSLLPSVPFRALSLQICLSELKYIEGHKVLYKDAIMENGPPLTSSDGYSNRNPPERWPRPLYSRDSTQEDQEIPQEDQDEAPVTIKVEVKEEAEEPYMSDDDLCKEEEIPPEINTDGTSSNNTPERCPRPLYSRDFMEEDPCILQDDQDENLIVIKVEALDEEDLYEMGEGPCKEDIPPKISTEGRPRKLNKEEPPIIAQDKERPYSCSECGKCFRERAHLLTHERVHTGEKPFSCSVCGKCFNQKSVLVRHEKVHLEEKPYSCSDCGKSFRQKSDLVVHERTHTSEKPYSCSECRKLFSHRSSLVKHQTVHTGHKPYSCPDCEKSFIQKSDLLDHQRIHTDDKPFSCSDCEKCFTRRSSLARHQLSHSTEKPYSCSKCHKSFRLKSTKCEHERLHSGEKPYSCSQCGKSYAQRSALGKHERTHGSERRYACSECGIWFAKEFYFVAHQRIHAEEKPS